MCGKEICRGTICLKCTSICMCINKHDKKGAHVLKEIILYNGNCEVVFNSGFLQLLLTAEPDCLLQLHLTNFEHAFEAINRVFFTGIHDSPFMVKTQPSGGGVC